MEMKLDRMDGSHAIVFFHRYRILRAIDMLDCPVMISACLFLVIKMKVGLLCFVIPYLNNLNIYSYMYECLNI